MSNKILISAYYEVACVASVSNRVIVRKLEREHSLFFFLLSSRRSRRTRAETLLHRLIMKRESGVTQ